MNAATQPKLVKHLKRYKLRAKVKVADLSATHRVWSVFDAPEAIRDWPVPSHARDIADQDQEAEEEEGEGGEGSGGEEGEDMEDVVTPGGGDTAGAGGRGGDGDGDGDEDGSGDGLVLRLVGEASDVGDSGIIPLPPVDPSVEVDEAARKKVDKAGPGVFFPDPRWHGKSRLSREQETAESDITSNLIECWSSYHSPTLFCLLSQAWDSVPSSQWE